VRSHPVPVALVGVDYQCSFLPRLGLALPRGG